MGSIVCYIVHYMSRAPLHRHTQPKSCVDTWFSKKIGKVSKTPNKRKTSCTRRTSKERLRFSGFVRPDHKNKKVKTHQQIKCAAQPDVYKDRVASSRTTKLAVSKSTLWLQIQSNSLLVVWKASRLLLKSCSNNMSSVSPLPNVGFKHKSICIRVFVLTQGFNER